MPADNSGGSERFYTALPVRLASFKTQRRVKRVNNRPLSGTIRRPRRFVRIQGTKHRPCRAGDGDPHPTALARCGVRRTAIQGGGQADRGSASRRAASPLIQLGGRPTLLSWRRQLVLIAEWTRSGGLWFSVLQESNVQI